jgi:hypothetical protein
MLEASPFLEIIESIYPRILSQIDRDLDSPTCGSCDRNYWLYKLRDFNSGTFQQTSLFTASTAKLFSSKSDELSELTKKINAYTLKSLTKNLTLDEYYPNERSYITTNFVLYSLVKSAHMVGDQLTLESEVLRNCFLKICKNQEATPAANQDSAKLAFICFYTQLFPELRLLAESTIQAILLRKESQSYFSEYGGTDLGYLSVTLNNLAYIDADGSYPVEKYLKRVFHQFINFIPRNGQVGGEFGSRCTSYYLPYGLIYCSQKYNVKLDTLDFKQNLEKIDDRYLMHYFSPSYAQTALFLKEHSCETSHTETPKSYSQIQQREGMSEDSSLYFYNSDDVNLYIGLNKGGSFSFYKGDESHLDNGYRLRTKGHVFATHNITSKAKVTEVEIGDEITKVTIENSLSRYSKMSPTPFKTIILRVIMFLGPLLNALFKKILIKDAIPLEGALFKRSFIFNKLSKGLTISDQFTGLSDEGALITLSPPSSFRLVPSAKFFIDQEERFYTSEYKQLTQRDFLYEL